MLCSTTKNIYEDFYTTQTHKQKQQLIFLSYKKFVGGYVSICSNLPSRLCSWQSHWMMVIAYPLITCPDPHYGFRLMGFFVAFDVVVASFLFVLLYFLPHPYNYNLIDCNTHL